MDNKVEISIDVIVHATEDISKFFESFENIFGLKKEEFMIQYTTGHYENPIVIINSKIIKKKARQFVVKLMETLSQKQKTEMIQEIEDRTVDSRFHVRLDKQEFIKGKLAFREKDAIKLKIHTPVYNKKDTVEIFSKMFQLSN
jgi:hypothetical protein